MWTCGHCGLRNGEELSACFRCKRQKKVVPFELLVNRVQSTAFFTKDDGPSAKGPAKHKIVRRCECFTLSQLQLLVGLLEGTHTLLNIAGEQYALRAACGAWTIARTDASDLAYSINAELTACTCPDSKFRENVCKHLLALQGLGL